MIDLLITIGLGLISVLGVLFGLRERDKRKDLEGYKDTRERIDEVHIGDDPAVLRDRMRERGER